MADHPGIRATPHHQLVFFSAHDVGMSLLVPATVSVGLWKLGSKTAIGRLEPSQ